MLKYLKYTNFINLLHSNSWNITLTIQLEFPIFLISFSSPSLSTLFFSPFSLFHFFFALVSFSISIGFSLFFSLSIALFRFNL